jgi:hypothetical protein
MGDRKATSNPKGVARFCWLPHRDFDPAWAAIKFADQVKEQLLPFIIRQHLAFETASLHDLILLTSALGISKRRHVGGKR